MDDKIKKFNQQRALLNIAIQGVYTKYENHGDDAKEHPESLKKIITNLVFIQKALNGITFNADNLDVRKAEVDAYLEIAEYTLRFLCDRDTNFEFFYQKSLEDGTNSTPKWLDSTLKYLIWTEKFLIFSTLFFAATPTLMVSLLPSLFSIAMVLITPMLIVLPPMAIASCAVGLVLFSFKMAQLGIEKCPCKNDKTKEEFNGVKLAAANRLRINHHYVSLMNDTQRNLFFSLSPDAKQKEASEFDVSNVLLQV